MIATVKSCTHLDINAALVDAGCLREAAACRGLAPIADLVTHVA